MAKLGLLTLDTVIKEYPINKHVTSIGRSPECDIRIDDASVSRNHAVIWHEPNTLHGDHHEMYIDDLGSRNGTFVNGLSISRQRLRLKDEITIGPYRFQLLDDHE